MAKRLPKVRGSQKTLHPAKKALLGLKSHVWAGKPKAMASLQAVMDLKQRRDNRVPPAPPLCLSTCRAQPTTINCPHGHQPGREPQRCPGAGARCLLTTKLKYSSR